MFARRPKIDTTFGVPMDLNGKSGKMRESGRTNPKPSKSTADQAPLVQQDRGLWGWLTGSAKSETPSAPPRPRRTANKPAKPQTSSWGERSATYTPGSAKPGSAAPQGNAAASFIAALESAKRRAGTMEISGKTLFNWVRIAAAIAAFIVISSKRSGDAATVLAGWAIAATVIGERLGLLKSTGFGASSLPGLAGRSIAFVTGAMLGLGLGALAGAGQLPLPSVGGLTGVFISGFVYALIGAKVGEWVATKANRPDLLGRPSP